jgi:hypothetical protein
MWTGETIYNTIYSFVYSIVSQSTYHIVRASSNDKPKQTHSMNDLSQVMIFLKTHTDCGRSHNNNTCIDSYLIEISLL